MVEMELWKEWVFFVSIVLGCFVSIFFRSNLNNIKMFCIDIIKYYLKYIYDDMDFFLL